MMKKFEIGTILVAIFGLLFLILRYPGSSFLLILSFSALSFYYAVRGMKIFKADDSQTPLSGKDAVISIVSGISLAVVLLGVLYKLMLWPGATVMLSLGIPLLAVVWAVVTFLNSKEKTALYSQILKRAVVIGIIGMGMFAISQDTLIDFRYRNQPDYANAYKAYRKDPGNIELKEKMLEEQKKMRMKYRDREATEE